MAAGAARRGVDHDVYVGDAAGAAIAAAEFVHAGAGLFNTLRNLGGAFGIAGLATVQAHAYALHRQELYSAVDPTNPHVQSLLQGMQAHLAQTGASDPERQALMYYAQILDREALVMTFNDQFLTLGVVIGISAFAMLLMKPSPARVQMMADRKAEMEMAH